MYQCEATSVEGFVQQLVCYFASGYRWFVTGEIPAEKDPWSVDERLIFKYGIDLSKYQRARRKQRGEANLQYLRWRRFFVLVSSCPFGGHPFFEAERSAIRDARKQPVRVGGYAVSIRRDGSEQRHGRERWRAHVRIDRDRYLELRAHYLESARRWPRDRLEAELRESGLVPYAPVRRQLLALVRDINREREPRGLAPIRISCLRLRRSVVKPFEWKTEARPVGASIRLVDDEPEFAPTLSSRESD